MTRFSVGIVGGDSSVRDTLGAALTLLGERLVDAQSADALFSIDGAASQETAGSRPLVSCNTTAPAQSGLRDDSTLAVAQLSLPANRIPLERAIAALHRRLQSLESLGHDPLPEIVGSSETSMALKRRLAQVAKGDSTVLLTGPSGTGKSFLAQTIHRYSQRASAPFVPINCGAIPTELIESELFGHEKGAFTGAVEQRLGRFDMAKGGTLFLDEIGDMPYNMQVKLLRAIQERVFERVGGVDTLNADVRIIAATNVDLDAKIRENAFREDLFYRLNVFPVPVPSLSERASDIPALVEHFSETMCEQYGHSVRFTAEAVHQLQLCPWPGNLRELANLVERLTVEYGDQMIGIDSLPGKYQSNESEAERSQRQDPAIDAGLLPINGMDLKAYLAELEQSLIEQALRDTDAVVARAADRLHIRRTTLVEKMRKYGIERSAH